MPIKAIKIAVLSLGMLAATAQADDQQFCLPSEKFTINGIPFLASASNLQKVLGVPRRMKKWFRRSEGNEGSYFMNDYVYKDVVFSTRMGVDFSGTRNRIQKAAISGPSVTVGNMALFGADEEAFKKILGYKKTLSLNNSIFSVMQCENEFVNIAFRFGEQRKVDLITVESDSDSL
jgi:hypothetical protein